MNALSMIGSVPTLITESASSGTPRRNVMHFLNMNADGKYKKSGLYDDDKYEVFQWLLSIAGDLTFRFHAWNLAQYALREWYQVDD